MSEGSLLPDRRDMARFLRNQGGSWLPCSHGTLSLSTPRSGDKRGESTLGPVPSPDQIPRPLLLSPCPGNPEGQVVCGLPWTVGGNLASGGRLPMVRLHGLDELVWQAYRMALDVVGKP